MSSSPIKYSKRWYLTIKNTLIISILNLSSFEEVLYQILAWSEHHCNYTHILTCIEACFKDDLSEKSDQHLINRFEGLTQACILHAFEPVCRQPVLYVISLENIFSWQKG